MLILEARRHSSTIWLPCQPWLVGHKAHPSGAPTLLAGSPARSLTSLNFVL